MKPASEALQALLAGASFAMADCYRLTLDDDTVLAYAAADYPVVAPGGPTYRPVGLSLKRSGISTKVGLDVDRLTVTALPDAQLQVDGVPFLAFCREGGLDGATLALERAFMPAPAQPVTGMVPLFAGRISEIALKRGAATLTVTSAMELLDFQVPRTLFQAGCTHTLYDSGCAVARADHTKTLTIGTDPTEWTLPVDGGDADGTYTNGAVTLPSGERRTVRAHAGGLLTLAQPLLDVPAAGSTVLAAAGCDKTMATCAARFDNLVRFRGMPFIPAPETAQ